MSVNCFSFWCILRSPNPHLGFGALDPIWDFRPPDARAEALPNENSAPPLSTPLSSLKKNGDKSSLFVSAVFKAPQHPQLRVGRKLCKGPWVYKKFWKKLKGILKCLIMRHSQTRPKCTILSQKILLKIWPVSLTKNSGSTPVAARRISQRGRNFTKHGTAFRHETNSQYDDKDRHLHRDIMTCRQFW